MRYQREYFEDFVKEGASTHELLYQREIGSEERVGEPAVYYTR